MIEIEEEGKERSLDTEKASFYPLKINKSIIFIR